MLSFILKIIFFYLLITFIMFIYRFYKTIQGVKKQMRGEGQSSTFGGFEQESHDRTQRTKKSSPQKGDVEVEYKVIKEE